MVKEYTLRFLREVKTESVPFSQLGLPFEMGEALKYLSALYREWQ